MARCGWLRATVATRLTGGDAMKDVKPVELLVKNVIPTTNMAMAGASQFHDTEPKPGTAASAVNSGAATPAMRPSENSRVLRFAEGRRGIQERNWFSS